MALEHDAGNASLTGGDLLSQYMGNLGLTCEVLVAVTVAAIDYEVRWQVDGGELI